MGSNPVGRTIFLWDSWACRGDCAVLCKLSPKLHGGWKDLTALGIDGLGLVAPEAALAGMAINAAAMTVTAMSASNYDAKDPQFTGLAPVTRGLTLAVSGYVQAAASPLISLTSATGFVSRNWRKFGKGLGGLSAINDGISAVHDYFKCIAGN